MATAAVALTLFGGNPKLPRRAGTWPSRTSSSSPTPPPPALQRDEPHLGCSRWLLLLHLRAAGTCSSTPSCSRNRTAAGRTPPHRLRDCTPAAQWPGQSQPRAQPTGRRASPWLLSLPTTHSHAAPSARWCAAAPTAPRDRDPHPPNTAATRRCRTPGRPPTRRPTLAASAAREKGPRCKSKVLGTTRSRGRAPFAACGFGDGESRNTGDVALSHLPTFQLFALGMRPSLLVFRTPSAPTLSLRGAIHVGPFLSVDVPNAVDREGHQGFLIPTAPAQGQHQAHGEAANGAFANFLLWQLSELSRRPFSGMHRESKPTTRQPCVYCGPGWD